MYVWYDLVLLSIGFFAGAGAVLLVVLDSAQRKRKAAQQVRAARLAGRFGVASARQAPH